ncbi:MAG TPA: hypothetical protein VGB25_00135 [Candidatus Binatia bacterium]
MERGEADVVLGGIAGFVREVAHWFQEGYTVPIVLKNPKGQGAEGFRTFPQGRPSLNEFADTEVKKAMIRIYNATNLGSAFYVHKDIPPPALSALKQAFGKAWKDPEFARDHERITRDPLDPIGSDELNELLNEVSKGSKFLPAYKDLVGGGPLPPSR